MRVIHIHPHSVHCLSDKMDTCYISDSLETEPKLDSNQRMGHGQNGILTSILAMDSKGAIGCKNALPWRLRSDLAFFKKTTTDSCVIMGRKTFESLGSKCLPSRDNVVLSHNNVLFPATERCKLALSISEALFTAEQFGAEETYVIGGGLTYSQFAPLVDRYLVTIVDHEVPQADAYVADDILSDLTKWSRDEIAKYPATVGQDDHPFAVYEIWAPDADARATKRAELITSYRAKVAKSQKPKAHKRNAPSSILPPQDAFAF